MSQCGQPGPSWAAASSLAFHPGTLSRSWALEHRRKASFKLLGAHMTLSSPTPSEEAPGVAVASWQVPSFPGLLRLCCGPARIFPNSHKTQDQRIRTSHWTILCVVSSLFFLPLDSPVLSTLHVAPSLSRSTLTMSFPA